MLVIFATGNYNFFNILTVVLCFSLLTDSYRSKFSTSNFQRRLGRRKFSLFKTVLIGVGYGAIVYYSIYLYELEWRNGIIHSKVGTFNLLKD